MENINILDQSQFFTQFLNLNTTFRLWEETITRIKDPSNFSPFSYSNKREKTGKLHFAITTQITEKLVGISNDSIKQYKVPWELIREETLRDQRYAVFVGWGDPLSGDNLEIFEGKEIMVKLDYILVLYMKLQNRWPEDYKIEYLQRIIGLENVLE